MTVVPMTKAEEVPNVTPDSVTISTALKLPVYVCLNVPTLSHANVALIKSAAFTVDSPISPPITRSVSVLNVTPGSALMTTAVDAPVFTAFVTSAAATVVDPITKFAVGSKGI